MIKFILKGILRDRSRSLFPVLVVAIGVFLTVLFYSYMGGVMTSFLDTSAKFDTGHLKIMSRAYAENSDQMPNDLAYIGVERLINELKKDFPGYVWTKRIRFGGLLDVPDDSGETRAQGPVAGLALDLFTPDSLEWKLLGIKDSIVQGNAPEKPGEILISDEFAKRLGISPGETVTLIGSTMYGSMAAANFTVAGTVHFGITALDRGAVVADVTDIQMALDMEDAAGEILGFFDNFVYREEEAGLAALKFNVKYEGEKDEFSPVMMSLHEQGGMIDMMGMINLYLPVLVIVFVIIMSIVLWNAGLIGSLRRYGEIGVRLAMGESKGHLYRSTIIESIFLGVIGTVIGTALALVIAFWLQEKGFNISQMMQSSTLLMNDVIRAKVTPMSFVIGFIPGLLSNVFGSSIAGIGIYKRKTAQLMKELEV
ncbi:MAG: ABC transporter permease [Acidobacteria bacterium]|nr:ABC transporter permease [Acidobacteriota bacterium]MBU4254904.1 ABC transporter permease [Acidobacteriota bacterium]MCG2815590.1 FtsX-like permease family protein [Candidatus Aminicenantes bacterium]